MLLKKFICELSVFFLIWLQYIHASPISEDVTTGLLCRDGEFRCKTGACVEGFSRCNGTTECSDGSDETFVLCRNDKCVKDEHRCAYGACVTGSACDGIQHCADSSDEALFKCLPEKEREKTIDCINGQLIAEENICNGMVDCSDGSDENVARCGDVTCPVDSFRCAYGGCAHKEAMCNWIIDCADGSDELDEICNRTAVRNGRLKLPKSLEDPSTVAPSSNICELPPQPDHGSYSIVEDPNVPTDIENYVVLNYTCNKPFRLVGKPFVICNIGHWTHEFPTCQAVCKLVRDRRVEYRCLLSGNKTLTGYKLCDYLIPEGMRVQPVCKDYHYNPNGSLPIMVCQDGKWNYTAMCIPDCGKPVSKGIPLMAGGEPAKRGELPWHAGIYSKKSKPYEQICGGSIISTKVIVSAAHCFWESGHRLLPCNYAVAVGKLYREWDDPRDDYVQRQDVLDIKIPPRFRGAETNFQDDIALVILDKAVHFVMYVRPVCLDFDYKFNEEQLKAGNLGKVSGWGYTSAEGRPSPFLKVAELPVVSLDRCFNETPFGFTSYITTDKICAGYTNGTAVCKGDSGGGLSFPKVTDNVIRYYIRGIVSTAPSDNLNCNTQTITAFTRLLRHQDFIQSHFTDFERLRFQVFDSKMVTPYNDTSECPPGI